MHSQRKVYKNNKWVWEKFREDHGFDVCCMIRVRASMLNLLGQGIADEG